MRSRIHLKYRSFIHLVVLLTVLGIGDFSTNIVLSAERPKIGLVLAGGGARGGAHIGVLQLLEELRIPIDYIAGTSIGSIVGGLYASGKTPTELRTIIDGIDWNRVFRDKPPRSQLSPRRKKEDNLFLVDKLPGIKDGKLKLPQGVIQGQRFYTLIKNLTESSSGIIDFDQFTPKFRAIGTDLETGKEVVIGHGDLATAIRASMSVPALFAPVERDGRLLVDGGLANNLPVSVVKEMGADIVIAVDITTPLVKREQLDTFLSVAEQLSGFLTRRNTLEQIELLGDQDILITPDLSGIGAGNFDQIVDTIQIGYESASILRQRLDPLGISRQDYAAYNIYRTGQANPQIIVQFIDVETGTDINEALIRKNVTQPIDDPLDIELINQSIGNINGLGYFEAVFYDVTERDGMTGIKITARPRSWGPRYLQLGLGYSNNLSGQNSLNLRLGYLIAPRGPDGSEWSTVALLGQDTGINSEFFRPIRPDSPLFTAASVFANRERFNIFDQGELISQNDVNRLGGSFRFGRFLGNLGETSVGLRLYTGNREQIIGPVEDAREDIEGGEIFLDLSLDSLDNVNFPRNGQIWQLRTLHSDEALGADSDFSQAALDFFGARSYGGYTFNGGFRVQLTPVGNAPLQNLYRVGGLFELGGVSENELTSENILLLRAGIMKRLNQFLGSRPYAGGLLQFLNAPDTLDDFDFNDGIAGGSVFLGWDTLLGPIYIGYGASEGGFESLHLLLGKQY